MTKKEILQFLKNEKEDLSRKYGVKTIALFGSFARGEEHKNSDIDIAVEMPPSFDNFFELKYFLEKSLKRDVDLVKIKNIRAFIRDKIKGEMLYV